MLPLGDKCLRLVETLAGQYGWCFAHEATKRRKLGEKYGQRPGEKSVGRAERRAAAEGLIERRRYYPGEKLPPGLPMRTAGKGLVLVRKVRRQERRANARAKKKNAARRPPEFIGDTPRPNREERRRRERKPLPPPPEGPRGARAFEPPEAWELEAAQALLRAIKKPDTP